MGDFAEFTAQYAEVLAKALNMPVLITDRDRVISAAGGQKREFADRKITKDLEDVMENRSGYVSLGADAAPLYPLEGEQVQACMAFPIIGNGDVSGCVCALFNAGRSVPADAEVKLVQVAAQFLAKQTED